ncbi:histone-lysine N-methyltransferase SETMAR-like [Solenopsis invicta]|uniref:histone-lysine N-methyltransferase SETMAR-like n=1 Tax=Solenopsis invicta TaxID=13686 RepID=UPI000595D93D|nr:histone-lysine N-methyltransferase SETMAR-like [Solenopsis invicta]
MEQRAVIKFNARLGKSASETFQLVQQVYGDACLSRSNVFVWHKRFLDGRESLEDDQHTGRPVSIRKPETIEKIRNFIANHRNASLRMMEAALNINRETIRTILHEDLGKTKVCAKFVPHTLTDEQKAMRVSHSIDIVVAARNNPNFLKSIVTGDEIWCFQFDSTTKRQSAEWKSKNSPEAKKTRKVPSKINTMLITFFDSKGIIHKEFVPSDQIVTGDYYLEVLKRLMARIRRIRPDYQDPNSWTLLHDNAPSHKSLSVCQFLARNQVCVLNYPPYSPDLAPCHFSVFPKLKLKLKGCFFEDIPTIQTASTRELEAIPQNELNHAFESLLNRCNKCIEARGDYFE